MSTVNDYLWTEGLVYDTNRLSPTMQYWDQFTGASNHTHIFYQVTSIVQMIEWGKSVDLLSSHKHFLLSLWNLKTTWFCELVNRINRLHWGGALVFQLAAPRAGHIQDQNTGSIAILANVFIIYYSYTNIVLRIGQGVQITTKGTFMRMWNFFITAKLDVTKKTHTHRRGVVFSCCRWVWAFSGCVLDCFFGCFFGFVTLWENCAEV